MTCNVAFIGLGVMGYQWLDIYQKLDNVTV